MLELIDAANGLLWGKILIFLLLGVGIYFNIKSRFVQIRHFGHMFSVMRNSTKAEHGGISSFAAFSTSLAARVGAGNIAGVAVAISLGGPGAVFWMWVVAIVGMVTSMVESTLAQIYKRTDEDGTYRGGPAYYMEKGLGQRWMGVLFSIFLIIAFPLVFNAVQSNTMTVALNTAFGVDSMVAGLIIAVLSGFIIFGGIRRIAHFAEFVVPFMAVAYLIVALFVVFSNIGEIPGLLVMIVKSAFGIHEMAGGAIGAAMMQGIKRGLFSNEAGLGSAPNAAATADVPHPASQGYVQGLGVFIDTIVICTCTASIILLSGVYQPGQEMQSVTLTQEALSSHVGSWGATFIAIALLFFSFTSIVANYYFGETSLLFINDNHRILIPFRIIVLCMVVFGALQEVPLIWGLADLSMGLMALLNLIAILLLTNVAFKAIHDYDMQLREGKEPRFDKSKYPELDHHIEDDVW